MSGSASQFARVPVYIAAGGQSSRFGSDKARALIAGKPIIQRIAQELEPIASRIIVVSDMPDKYADLGLETIADITPGRGPIAALQMALYHAGDRGGHLLLVSCDLAGVKRQWVEQLLAAATDQDRAIAFKDQDHWEPLLALYAQSLISFVDGRIARDQLAMWGLLQACNAKAVPKPRDWVGSIDVD